MRVKFLLAFCAALLTAASCFAQVTLNLDILDDEPPPAPAPKVQPKPSPKPAPSQKAPVPAVQKPKPAQTKKPAAERPVVLKPPAVEKKPPVLSPPTVADRLEIKEAAVQDEHDKLKPKAAPVHEVRFVPVEKPEEKPPVKTAEAPAFPDQKETPEEKEEPQEQAKAASVISFDGSLKKDRSKELARHIPDDSATKQALAKNGTLFALFVFPEDSTDLTDDMKKSLDRLARLLESSRTKRVVLFSYASSTPAALGRERHISLHRALQIRTYLSQIGFRSLRVDIRSMGTKGAGSALPDRTDIVISER